MSSPRLFFKTSTVDPQTELPLYVFDTSFLPKHILENKSSEEKVSQLTQHILSNLPSENYCLILMTSGLADFASPSTKDIVLPINLIKFFKLIPQDKISYLVKLYVVHGNWIVNYISQIFKTFLNFGKDIIHCENLAKLGQYVDIIKIPISISNYVIDQCVYHNDKLVINKHFSSIYGVPLNLSNQFVLRQFSKIYNNIMGFLATPELDTKLSQSDWQMLIRCGSLNVQTQLNVNILSDCLKRNQELYLSDFSFLEHYMVLTKFLTRLSESTEPLLPISLFSKKKTYNFEDVNEVKSIFNDALHLEYQIKQNSKQQNTPNSPFGETRYKQSKYNNGYLLIKLFKLFHLVMNKLTNEIEIIEPSAKNFEKVKERQKLRLVLSFTKILYNEDSTISDDDDISFDYMFKFINAALTHFDEITIFNTSLKIDDFNYYINSDDLFDFENLKNEQQASSITLSTSPMFKRTIAANTKLRTKVPPTPPIPRKFNLRSVSNSSSDSISSDAETDFEKENTDPIKKQQSTASLTSRLRNELVKPSEQVSGKLLKYTEKELLYHENDAKKVPIPSPKKTIKGRKVSKLTLMYEQEVLKQLA